MNHVWVAAGVAVINKRTDQGYRWKSGIMRRLFSGAGSSDLRPLSSVSGTDLGGIIGGSAGDDRSGQDDESLRRVMFMNCWGQS
ncbi:hypothetical protein Nepgr_012892 [Nepenthes gracilis]|uniref:Uncharacterized protein n=1 Tax=Nepenthes gracilis TaxID=150966 RepID=A0AAD3SIC0_NEPGR|nr:hypothetical protein Nepgr_012892 [Nepenthes gracilis]